MVVGSISPPGKNADLTKARTEVLRFIRSYLRDVIHDRRKQGVPMPILAVSNFGHGIRRNLMAVPIGGRVTISRTKTVTFQIKGGAARNGQGS